MAKEIGKPEGKDTEREVGNARVGYQVAVHLATAYSSGVWSIFNAMLVANSIFLAGIGIALTGEAKNTSLALLLSFGGLAVCTFWLLLVRRPEKLALYYTGSALALEKQLGDVKTLSKGEELAERKRVVLKSEGDRECYSIGLTEGIRGRFATASVVAVFSALYLVFLLWAVVPHFWRLAQLCVRLVAR